jgi:RNA-binding protein
MPLTPQQIRDFRGQAHHLKPIVMVGGKGLSDSLLAELDRALNDHELIKVTIAGAEREERRQITEELCRASSAEVVQIIGRISVLYRKRREQ